MTEDIAVTEDNVIKARTAFLIIQDLNGGYYALNTLDKQVNVEKAATLQDMKVACQEIRDAIYRADIANAIKGILDEKSEEPVSTSIREALEERDIL